MSRLENLCLVLAGLTLILFFIFQFNITTPLQSTFKPSTTIGGFADGNINYDIVSGQIDIKDESGQIVKTIITNSDAKPVNYGISSDGNIKIIGET